VRILLISPKTPETFWSYRHALPFISKQVAFPPLGLLTVAAMLPASWQLKLVDMNRERLAEKDIVEADYVFLSAMIVHRDSVREIVELCQSLGTPIVAGGPLFTTGHRDFPEIQHFALGECEEFVAELVSDMEAGTLQRIYRASRFPSLAHTPVPRWDLVRLADYASVSVQFSRGCPFQCEFCDIVIMNGRVPRTKSPEQVLGELQALHDLGWKGSVFLVDDNFIGNRSRVKKLLRAIVDWRRESGAEMGFTTEASINLADDTELLDLMREAGFVRVFVGIESPESLSLEGCQKVQNTGRELLSSVRTIQNAGMEVLGGFIVGFDADGPDIFERQFDFIQSAGVVTAMVGLLNALPKTRLYVRLQREGRLLQESCGNNTEAVCNFVTKLDREFLLNGYRALMKRLYEPETFYQRARTFLSQYRLSEPSVRIGIGDLKAFARSLWVLGVQRPGRREYWRFLAHTFLHHRRAFGCAVAISIYGHHFRVIAKSL